MEKSDDRLGEYRKGLQTLEQQMQSEYDKAVMALSGGAIGVSMTFLKDVVLNPGGQVRGGWFLLAAWICWGLSVGSTLYSFFTSACALRRAVRQVDENKIYKELVGGRSNTVTKMLNICSGLLFIGGIGFIVVFTGKNLR